MTNIFGLHAMLICYLLEGPPRTKTVFAQEFNISPDAAGKYINELVRQKLMISIGNDPEHDRPSNRRGIPPERFIPMNQLIPNLEAIRARNLKKAPT